MNHHEIEQQDIIDRYLMHRLNATERMAFQEHFFDCDECFGKVQTSAQVVAGVKHSSRHGILSEVETAPVVSWWANWFKPAFALASAAAVLLAIGLGWTLFSQIPKLRDAVARERQAREQVAREKDQNLQSTKDELEKERQALALARTEQEKLRAQLDQQIAQNKPSNLPAPIGQVQANAPIVLLEAQRDAKAASNQLSLPAAAKTATFWIELAPDARFDSYQLQIFDQGKRVVTTVNGAKLNSYGALAVNIPARALQPAKYVVKAFGIKGSQRELIGEYDLMVRKQ